MRRLLLAALTAALAVVPAAPAQAATTSPVILIHGYNSSTATWDPLVTRLKAAGYASGDVHTFGYHYRQSNVTTAARLADYVEKVREDHGGVKVDLVGHSMGAVIARYYVRDLGGAEVVDDLVSLAGPHHGTRVLTICRFDASCREMLPGSAFLRALNAGDETPGDVAYRTFYSKCDLIVVPYASALLDGAQNTNVGCVGHTEFRLVPSIAEQIIKELRN
ncbi:triacylglycerol esterase/lipase EstA (alpha/beta hydrolase family) [Catenuloplanes nepalensis]|uniref:Triacylglycerol esterase/lipase EstA (Alpha/beta hydrolase family) n=1 Tax=Catenuloplanes nepalensis TaxID=587533 RepID=A0ABT9N0R4_9ACTN|nr:alpha/beta fold hydrolase [Catenuloplanes nepalensis]MDP9797285.1 triacylglycerol esterase/lipase EstA (alpha/beta hydrolase family) [Catenuloplanes nepalensis]